MPDKPKISAVLPCFNHAKFLEERISSVLEQTYRVDQIIFLDDASTDGSVDIAKKLLRRFPGEVVFYINSLNSGSPFAQWNKGVRLAKHDLVWIAETDDACKPRFIESLCNAIVTSGAVLGFAQSRYIDERGHELGSALAYMDTHWPGKFHHSFSMDGRHFNAQYLAYLNAIPNASAVLFSKQAFIAAGLSNESMRYCGDWDAWIRICAWGRVQFVSDELNFFRSHPSTTRSCGYTPLVAAEMFACNLQVCIGASTAISSSISAFRLINGLLNPRTHWQWNHVVRSLSRKVVLPESQRRYQELVDVPCISAGAWIGLRCIYNCLRVSNQTVAFLSKVIRFHSNCFQWLLER